MADPVGLAASVSTLGALLFKLFEFAAKFKDSHEDLSRYCMVLKGIKMTTSLMADFANQFPPVKETKVIVEGKEENIIHFCSVSVKSLITDVEQLTKTLKTYYGEKGKKDKAAMRALRRVKDFIKGFFQVAPTTLAFILNQNTINDLIQAAKQMESSMNYAFSTILLTRNEIKTDETQRLINDMKDSFTTHFRDFQDWRKTFKKRNPVVIDVKAHQGIQHSAESSSRSRPDKNTSTSSSGTQIGKHNAGGTALSSRSSQCLGSVDGEPPGETVAVIRNDGSLHPSQYIGQFAPSGQGQHTGEEVQPSEAVQTQIIRLFPFIIRHEGSEDTTVVGDTDHLDIDNSVEAFIDSGVLLSNCVSPTGDDRFRFCIRTMIIHDTEPPVLIFKEPCGSRTCGHIVVCARSGLTIDHDTPCYLQALLRENGASESVDADCPSQQHVRLFFTSYCERTSKNFVTLVLRQSGRYKTYALPSTFTADFATDIKNDRKGATERFEDDSESKEHSDTSSGASTASFQQASVSFLQSGYCSSSTERQGGQALLLVKNNSFGYTCERRGERTWISATEYGLTGIGAAWSWW
ncbi:hypothetical protein BDW66DRAFT_163537 [Aspergillus desertorum]